MHSMPNKLQLLDYLDDVSNKYIDNKDFYTFFGQTSPEARIAEQMANNPVYKIGGAPSTALNRYCKHWSCS